MHWAVKGDTGAKICLINGGFGDGRIVMANEKTSWRGRR
jgi:hypothetical protein